jgi:hypothetical protein
MTRFSTSKRIGLIGGTLLAGSLFAATAAAQTAPGTGPGPGTGVGPRTGGFGPPASVFCRGAGPIGGPGVEHAAVAQGLGISSDELYALRSEGKSIAQIAEEKGVALDDVTASMLATHKAGLDERVQAGTLTQEQADAMLGFMQTRIDAVVEATGAGPRHGMVGPRGGPGGNFGGGFGPRWAVPTPAE